MSHFGRVELYKIWGAPGRPVELTDWRDVCSLLEPRTYDLHKDEFVTATFKGPYDGPEFVVFSRDGGLPQRAFREPGESVARIVCAVPRMKVQIWPWPVVVFVT